MMAHAGPSPVSSTNSANSLSNNLASQHGNSSLIGDVANLHPIVGAAVNCSNNSQTSGGEITTTTAANIERSEDDLNSLEAEISELQRENARVESQMMRLKSDINAMETQLHTSDRVRRLRFVEVKLFPI